MALASSDAWRARARLDFDEIPDCSSHSKPRGASGHERELQQEIDSIRRSIGDRDALSLIEKLEKLRDRDRRLDFRRSERALWANSLEDLQTELMDMDDGRNGSAINDIKHLIQTITRDAKAMETVLNSAETSLDNCELVRSKCVEDAGLYNSKYEMEKMMLNDSIEDCRYEGRRLAEQIEMKRRELKHLENVAKLKDSYLQDNKILEALKGVSVLAISTEHIVLQLRTYLPDTGNEHFKLREDSKKLPDCVIHELDIVFNAATPSIVEAELKPKDVEMSDIVSAVQEDGDFFEKLAFIVKEVQNRIRWRRASRCHSRNRR